MTRSQKGLAGFFAFAGTMHFVIPRSYEAMMPPSLPLHREAVVVSGLAEIAGGAAIVPRRTRRLARWWLLALLAAVFPANIHMAAEPRAGPRPRPRPRPALGALGPSPAPAALRALGLARNDVERLLPCPQRPGAATAGTVRGGPGRGRGSLRRCSAASGRSGGVRSPGRAGCYGRFRGSVRPPAGSAPRLFRRR